MKIIEQPVYTVYVERIKLNPLIEINSRMDEIVYTKKQAIKESHMNL